MDNDAKKHVQERSDDGEDRRVTFVRVPKGANTSIFGGWGVKI